MEEQWKKEKQQKEFEEEHIRFKAMCVSSTSNSTSSTQYINHTEEERKRAGTLWAREQENKRKDRELQEQAKRERERLKRAKAEEARYYQKHKTWG